MRISICQSNLLTPGCVVLHEEKFETLEVLEPHPRDYDGIGIYFKIKST